MERIHILIQQERIIEECVDELIELIDNSRTPAFGGEDRRVVETGAVTEKFNILKEIAAASGNDKLLIEAKKPKMRFLQSRTEIRQCRFQNYKL